MRTTMVVMMVTFNQIDSHSLLLEFTERIVKAHKKHTLKWCSNFSTLCWLIDGHWHCRHRTKRDSFFFRERFCLLFVHVSIYNVVAVVVVVSSCEWIEPEGVWAFHMMWHVSVSVHLIWYHIAEIRSTCTTKTKIKPSIELNTQLKSH